MRKEMKKIAAILLTVTMLTPIVSALSPALWCVQKIKYIPGYEEYPPGAWVGTIRIPTSPSNRYDIVSWADPEPAWYGPPGELGVVFPGSIEVFHETIEFRDQITGEILATGYDDGYFDIESGKWKAFGEVTWVLEGGELEFLEGKTIRSVGKVLFINDMFKGSGMMKLYDIS